MTENEIVVSIICNTYNQEKYIEQAIEGFIKQKTNFKFEVLIHDDASTDKTALIIMKYEKKYPDLIKPIYQKENQYSKKISITNIYQLPRAKGKYIAFCEGDDFWTNEQKLQMQVDALERHPEIDICAHAVSVIRDEKVNGAINPFSKNTIVSTEQVILYGGDFIGTCSILYRRSIDREMPRFRKYMSLDYTIQIHGSMRGGLLYIDENMANYRIGSIGSWTNRVLRNPQKAINHYNNMIVLLKMIDEDTNYKYDSVVSFVINEYKFKKAYANGDIHCFNEMAKRLSIAKNKKIYKKLNVKAAVKLGIKYQFPFLYKYLHKK